MTLIFESKLPQASYNLWNRRSFVNWTSCLGASKKLTPFFQINKTLNWIAGILLGPYIENNLYYLMTQFCILLLENNNIFYFLGCLNISILMIFLILVYFLYIYIYVISCIYQLFGV